MAAVRPRPTPEYLKFIQKPSRPKRANQPEPIRNNQPGLDPKGIQQSTRPFDQSEPGFVGASHILPPTDIPYLSPRQREVLFWAAHGKSAWVTAQLMGLKETTVKSYLASTCARLNADNKTHAVAIAFHHGIIGLMPNKLLRDGA